MDNGIKFPTDINVWEDVQTIIPLYFFANRIAYVPEALYHYRIWANSLSRNKDKKNKTSQDMILATCEVGIFLKKQHVFEKYKGSFRWLQLAAKMGVLTRGDGEGVVLWKKTFPETNSAFWFDFRFGLRAYINRCLNRLRLFKLIRFFKKFSKNQGFCDAPQ